MECRRRNSGRDGHPGANDDGGIPDTMGIWRKIVAEEFRTREASGGKWRREKVPEREGVRVQMAAGKVPEREGVRVQMAARKAPERESVLVQMAAGEDSETWASGCKMARKEGSEMWASGCKMAAEGRLQNVSVRVQNGDGRKASERGRPGEKWRRKEGSGT